MRRRGHALIDRELYLTRSWTADPARCKAAGMPGGIRFATKPRLARKMITPGPWTPGRPLAEWPGMRSTAATRACAPAWNAGGPPDDGRAR